MDEAARVRALRDQGRIDDAQAERLLAALGEEREASGPASPSYGPAPAAVGAVPSASPEVGAEEGDAVAAGTSSGVTSTGTDATRSRPSTGTSATGTAGVVRRWARVEMFAGTLRIEVDAGLDAPRAEADAGDLEVTRDGDGWRIAQKAKGDADWIERIVDAWNRSRVTVRLPSDTGVDLDIKAGDVELHDVPALRGRLMAGDLDAYGLRAVDVALNAGDLDLRLDPIAGEHRVKMTVGDAEIRFPADAGVSVQGRVTVGDVSAPAPFETRRSGVSERVSGTLGDGRAALSVEVATGDLELSVQ